MIEKQTVIDQIELPGGTKERGLRVRLGLLIVDSGTEESRKFHRFEVGTHGVAPEWMRAAVDANLNQMGYPSIPDGEWAKVAAQLKD